MASDVTLSNALDFSQNSANSSAQLASDFDDFLILLTTQLQNQDPLEPADSTEFTNQLVSFAGVEQQINANQRLDSLVSLGLGTSFASSLNYVGLDVSYLSSETFFDGNRPVEINYTITGGDPDDTTINIFDESGDLVRSQAVSSDEAIETFIWDGRDDNGNLVPVGTYSIRVDSLDAQDAPLTTSTVVTGRVNGVETQNGSTFLLVGERAVSVGTLINVSEPSAATVNLDNDTLTDVINEALEDNEESTS